jgi:uncharacterized protein (DUF1501 family)
MRRLLPDLSRRALLKAGAGGLLLPTGALAAGSGDRRFLFVFNSGGWDTSRVFTPMFHSDTAEIEEGAVEAEANGVRFVDHEDRPSVRAFFEAYGDRCCVINGLEVQSVAHERCRQLVLTGSAGTDVDDWPSILAAHAAGRPALPHVVLDGAAFTSRYTDRVVRVGDNAQLADLLDGQAFVSSDLAVTAPTSDARALEEAFVHAQIARRLEGADPGGRALLEGYQRALEDRASLDALAGGLDLSVQRGSCERDIVADAASAFSLFERDVCRCAMLEYAGWCGEGWDTHSQLYRQSWNYEDLFSYLAAILADLDTRIGAGGGPLADELTIVVFSEMGRSPVLNSWGGKDHWTFTSAMLIGAGVQGGQVVGGLDSAGLGLEVEGTQLLAAHLGATLLAMGDVDPAEYLGDVAPISPAMR